MELTLFQVFYWLTRMWTHLSIVQLRESTKQVLHCLTSRKLDSPPDNKRSSHNTAEKRRRDKINESMEELRRLVPASPEDDGRKATNKAAILKRAADHLRELELLYERLFQEHHTLVAENDHLKHLQASVGLLGHPKTSGEPSPPPSIPFPTGGMPPFHPLHMFAPMGGVPPGAVFFSQVVRSLTFVVFTHRNGFCKPP